MDIVKADHVSKQFVGHKALDDVSLTVPEGSIYGILGPNGAGKTTLLRIINHITAPDTGTIEFCGHPLTQADVNSIGYLPEERGLYKKMKVGEQAMFFARLKGMSKHDASEQLHKWFDKFGISDWWNKKVEELSKGMAQKVQFIITVLHNPRLLIFDEPFSGFDPINAKLLKDEILELRDKGATIIFSTHNMASVETLCDEITLINKSHNILTGNVSEIRRRFGSDRYQFTFTGDEQKLLDAFGNTVTSNIRSERIDGDTTRLTLRFMPGTPLHDLIAKANDTVSLCAFSADLPSMDEIFITAVENNNRQSTNNQAL